MRTEIMPVTHTLSDLLGKNVDAPRRQVNADGALVAITYTEAQWADLDPKVKSERGAQRSVVARCSVRGVVSVDAFVVPAATAAAPKPWSRAGAYHGDDRLAA